MTTLANVRTLPDGWQDDPQYVYIGRANTRYGLPQSKWANPFRVQKESERESAIAKYRDYLLAQPDLLGSLDELRGKVLCCWCAPKRCHGDVLLELLGETRPALPEPPRQLKMF